MRTYAALHNCLFLIHMNIFIWVGAPETHHLPSMSCLILNSLHKTNKQTNKA